MGKRFAVEPGTQGNLQSNQEGGHGFLPEAYPSVFDEEHAPPPMSGGMLLRDLERPNWLPPSSPELIKDNVGVPSDAWHVMTMVGSDTNPALLLDARMVDLYQTESIPEVVELLPNEQRVPWPDDPRFPY